MGRYLDWFLPSSGSFIGSRGAAWRAGGPVTAFRRQALVNEAYLRLIDVRQMDWQDRAHFLANAARLMRRILVPWFEKLKRPVPVN